MRWGRIVGRRLVSIGGVMCKTDIAIGITTKLTGGNGAQRNYRPSAAPC
jgi:hypothetical protein